MSSLYNEEVKEAFLKQYTNEATRETYEYILKKVKPTEEIKEKDLYEFTGDELEDVFYDLEPFSIAASHTNFSVISRYIKWAIDKSLRSNNINPLREFEPSKLKEFVDDSKKVFVSEDELRELGKDLVNAQDEVIFRLAFEGVVGYQVSEILNLRKQDVNFETNELKLRDDKYGERTLHVSEECLRTIRQAINEEEYHLMNGLSTAKSPVKKLISSDYVVRGVISGRVKYGNDRADRHTIYRRISKLKEIFEYPYLTIKNIERSGMLKMAKDLYVKNGKLENEELALIADRFNIAKVELHGKKDYNYSVLKRVVNLDNVTRLYDLEIEKKKLL